MTLRAKHLSLLSNNGKPAMGVSMKTSLMIGAAMAAVWAMPVAAQPKIYPYASAENYCPTGLQPISINGVICCGTPNQNMTYQAVKVHPVSRAKKRHVRRVSSTYCPEGMKGCVSR